MGDEGIDVRRLETFFEINALINSQYRDVRTLLLRIMESAERLTGGEASSLLLLDKGTNQLYFEIALGDKGEDVMKYTLAMGEGIAGWVAQNDTSLIVNNVDEDPRHFSAIGEDTGFKTSSLLAVPLRARDEVAGVLEVINKTDGKKFTDDDLKWLEVFSNQASIALQNAREYGEVLGELDRLREKVSGGNGEEYAELIWKSPVMERLLAQTDKMARSSSPVLITGESGSGKELIAERVHRGSERAEGPLIRVNCAALPPDLVEAELFGYVKGAFTDAVRDKTGYFERADGGSLFLDEIGDLPQAAQGKLMRALQEGRFQRVGGDHDVSVDVRVIAATNQNLAEAADAGIFRQDLFYRLAVLTLEVPPLRERLEDIEVLATYYLKKFETRGENRDNRSFTLEALESLLAYRWPGNVRELQNAVERAVIVAKGDRIGPADLALPGREGDFDAGYRGKTLKEAVNLFKRNYVREILTSHGGNQTAAAGSLGIQRTYLSRLIKELDIERRENS